MPALVSVDFCSGGLHACSTWSAGRLTRLRAASPAGNFADGRKTFDVINYDDPKQFEAEREYIRWATAPAVPCRCSSTPTMCGSPAWLRLAARH